MYSMLSCVLIVCECASSYSKADCTSCAAQINVPLIQSHKFKGARLGVGGYGAIPISEQWAELGAQMKSAVID